MGEITLWETTPRDLNRNGIVDWLENIESDYPIGIMYEHLPTDEDIELLYELGVSVRYYVNSVNGLLLENRISYYPRTKSEGKKLNAWKDGLASLITILKCRIQSSKKLIQS